MSSEKLMRQFAAMFRPNPALFGDKLERASVEQLASFSGLCTTFPITARLQCRRGMKDSAKRASGTTWLEFGDALNICKGGLDTPKADALADAMIEQFEAITTPAQRMEMVQRHFGDILGDVLSIDDEVP